MQHLAKAYGKASVGSPPMSVPHLDTRVLGGKRVILFGPFATFSTKFLKEGSYFDLVSSVTTSNAWPMVRVGIDEYPLVEYLAGQLMMSDDDRFAALKEYFPNAKQGEWRLWQAGQRVQIIKRDEEKAACCGSEPKSSPLGTAASPACSALRRALPPLRRSCSAFWKRSSRTRWQRRNGRQSCARSCRATAPSSMTTRKGT